MRFYRVGTIMISDDDSSAPKLLRFKDDLHETIETSASLVKAAGSMTVTIPANTSAYSVPLPEIATGKYLYLLSDRPFTLTLNGGAALSMVGGKINELWCDFTSVTVGNADLANAVRLTWAIAGV